MSSDSIAIRGLEVPCVIGLYPDERDRSQLLRIDVELDLVPRSIVARTRFEDTVDYAALSAEIAFLLESARFRMLETAAHAIAAYVMSPAPNGPKRAPVESVRVTIAKPGALGGNGVPSVSVKRRAEDFEFAVEEKPFGTVDVIFESHEAGLYRLNVAPKSAIPLHVHKRMRECEMALTKGLFLQGKPLPQGAVVRWEFDTPHRYDNPTGTWQSILCLDAPRFDPSDEIEVEGEPALVVPDLRWVRPEVIS